MFGPPQLPINGVTNAVPFSSHSVMTSARVGWVDATKAMPSVAAANAPRVRFMVRSLSVQIWLASDPNGECLRQEFSEKP
jgi:hypothetical protein